MREVQKGSLADIAAWLRNDRFTPATDINGRQTNVCMVQTTVADSFKKLVSQPARRR
jgi:hypothetical protein